MTDKETPESSREKLFRALKAEAVLSERSKQLKKQVEDLRTREQTMHHLASELLERQRELNYMLHRASSVLHQLRDTNLALSAEFTHIVKELPPAKDKDWEETIRRVNELFKKTHELADDMQEEIFTKTAVSEPPRKPPKKWATEPAAEYEAWSAEREIVGPETDLVEPMIVEPQMAEPEPEPEIVELEPADEPMPRFDIEPIELEQAYEREELPEAEPVAVMEAETEAEIECEPTEIYDELERAKEEQIERLFQQIQPFELKPAPNGQDSDQQGFLSKVFRRNKTAV
jgi:hypothetical protein